MIMFTEAMVKFQQRRKGSWGLYTTTIASYRGSVERML